MLAVMAGAVLALQSMTARFEARARDGVRLEADVAAGFAAAVLALGDSRDDQRWPTDGTAHVVTVDGDPVRVAVADEAGFVDLNAADDTTLTALLRGVGMAPDDAEALVERITDWRTASDDATPEILARDGDYEAAGRDYRPRHAPFQSVDEFRLVLGVTPALYARVAPLLTVYSRNPAVDPKAASPAVAAALAAGGLTAGTVGTAAPSGGSSAGAPGHAFAITIAARHGTSRLDRRIVVAMTGDDIKPYFIEYWR